MLLTLALLGCSGPAATQPAPPHQDLLLVSIDTLRRDHVGRYNGGDETPFMDSLAAQSLALDDHHACSDWTYGAFMCVFRGADGVDAGFVPYGAASGVPTIPTDMQLLPGLLRAQGFRAGLVSTNGYVGSTSKMNRYYDVSVEEGMAPADEVVELGLDMLSQLRGADRWMLHLHFFDPHSPYGAPDGYLGELNDLAPIDYQLDEMNEVQRLAREWPGLDAETQALILEHLDVRYRASIRFLDDELARLFSSLEDSGDLGDALVVVFSDHGEQFYEFGELEHGKTLHTVETSTFAWFSGAQVEPGSWTERTTHADLAPTILSYLGLPPEGLAPASGLGGAGAVVGTADPERPIFATKLEELETMQSVDWGGKRLIYTWTGERQLFDLSIDPEEQDDRFGSDPDGEAMWAMLLPRVEALAAQSDQGPPIIP